MDMGQKTLEADKLMKKANKAWAPSLLDFRLKPDWEEAAPLFEKAALCYRQAGQLEKSRAAYERAARSQEKIGSLFHAAKHMETCAAVSKDMQEWDQVASFTRMAADYYGEAGKAAAGGDALARGAKTLEDKAPEQAATLYRSAIDLYETEGKEAQAADVFRQAVSLLVRAKNWAECVALLMRFGEACDRAGAQNSQCKSYLGAVVVCLYAEDARQAWQTFQDAMQVGSFASSDEAFAADALFLAYKSGSADKVKAAVQSKATFKHMDNQLARLALKLPTGDMGFMSRQVAALMGGQSADEVPENSDDEVM